MNDMASVIAPKSDQINADDLIAGPRTITITEVQVKAGQEQPVSIFFEGSDKAYRPCKSMARVLVSAWGPDASKYKGRSLTLYCDPRVKWGGMEVGGIRISHMSHIDSAITMALTVTRANKKPFTVKPLGAAAPKAQSGGRAEPDNTPVTEEQSLELHALCTEGGRDLTADLKDMAEVDKLGDIPARVLGRVKKWITQQRLQEHEGTQA